MMDFEIEYEQLADKSYLFFNIPDGNGETVTVRLRPLTRRDRNVAPADDDPEAVEKIISLICTKWGERESITTLELLKPDKDEAVSILAVAFAKFFQPRISFVERK